MTTAIFGLVGVVVGAALTALLNYYLQRAADRRRWDREDALRREHWEREDRAALRAERVNLYRAYVEQAHRVLDVEGFDRDKMRLMMYQIELLGSSDVTRWGVPIYFDAEDAWEEMNTPPSEGTGEADWHDLQHDLYKFNQAVRAELGIPEPPPKPPPRPIESDDE
jgi:hypothetical protein